MHAFPASALVPSKCEVGRSSGEEVPGRLQTAWRRSMKMVRGMGIPVAGLALALAFVGTAQANLISGNLYRVSEATSQNAIVANVPATTPDVTFQVNSPLNFSASSATIGVWLGTGGAFNIVQNTAGTLAALMDNQTMRTPLLFHGFFVFLTGP